jgi:hypothetical protein
LARKNSRRSGNVVTIHDVARHAATWQLAVLLVLAVPRTDEAGLSRGRL